MTTSSRTLRSMIAALLTTTTALPVGAGDASVAPGQKLRLSVLDRPHMVGVLLAVDEQQLKLQQADGTVRAVPMSEIQKIEVARRGSRFKGAGGGALIAGAIFGFAGLMGFSLDQVSKASADGRTCLGSDWTGAAYQYQCTTWRHVAGYVGGGVLMGAVLGAAVTPGERFVPVEPRRFALRVVPLPDGVAARVSLGF